MFRNKPVMVVGGGDSACEEALFLTSMASQVTLVHRRDRLRASKIMTERVLAHPKITIEWNSVVSEYHGSDQLEGVTLTDVETNQQRYQAITGLFLAIGHEPATKWLSDSPLQLDSQGYIVVHDQVKTSMKGVFSGGDCHDIHYRQAITAAGMGCMAALEAERYIESRRFSQSQN